MSVRLAIGQARGHLDDANGWAGALEAASVVTAKPGGVDREWDTRTETRRRLLAARAEIDRALELLGGGR